MGDVVEYLFYYDRVADTWATAMFIGVCSGIALCQAGRLLQMGVEVLIWGRDAITR